MKAAFVMLAEARTGGVFANSFEGETAWKRHGNGDELVQVLEGETHLTILADSDPAELKMKAGAVAS